MWYFNSPQIIFGEGALSFLETLTGQRAFIVTDATLQKLGFAERICQALEPTGMQVQVFAEVEPDPSLHMVTRGAGVMSAFAPDWIIALGGGSVMDAAKAMWVLYESPDIFAEAINPIEVLGLRKKARLVAIPTTTGTGSEATWAIVLTDTAEKRKLGLGNRETMPDYAVLDPEMVANQPARLIADTGLDALTHAVEGFTTTFHHDFSDGPCLVAAKLVLEHLPRAVADNDSDALARLQNAATIAGMGFGNAMAGLAHGMGHALGGVFHVPHGRAVALFLPYTIEYCGNEAALADGAAGPTRYAGLNRFLGLACDNEAQAASALVRAIRDLQAQVGQPRTIAELGIPRADFERELDLLVANALNDSQTVMATRVPENDDLRRLFLAAYDGNPIDF